jgi:hypothetical protein
VRASIKTIVTTRSSTKVDHAGLNPTKKYISSKNNASLKNFQEKSEQILFAPRKRAEPEKKKVKVAGWRD